MADFLDNADVMPLPVAADARVHVVEDFDNIIRTHQRHIYRVLISLVRDPDTADTLTQECFLRAFQKRASFRGEASVRTWLVKIAVNLARDHSRNRRISFWRRLFRSGEDDASISTRIADIRPDPERAAIARQELGAVWESLDKLSHGQRTVFILRFVDDMSLEQIAAATSTSVGTVKTQLFRAVAALRRETGRQK